jgi:Proline dehydrogenase.
MYSVIHLFPWSGLLDVDSNLSDTFRVPCLKEKRMVRLLSQLSKKEEEMFRNMVRRLNTLVRVSILNVSQQVVQYNTSCPLVIPLYSKSWKRIKYISTVSLLMFSC